MAYKRLTAEERDLIGKMHYCGRSLREIASELCRAPSTVSRELRRYSPQRISYFSGIAHQEALERAGSRRSTRKIDRNPALWPYIQKCLRLKWSPDQISKALRKEFPGDKSMQVSPETIYTYLFVLPRGSLKKELLDCLRSPRKRRGRRYTKTDETRGRIEEMLSIEERPQEVADRIVPGHWEGDLLMGKLNRTAIGTLVERTTRTVLLVPLEKKDAASVREAFAREMKTFPTQLAKSLTYDQGKEMAEHKLFTKQTKIQVYFAHPRSPWERGSNENTNGLLRQFFPKGIDFSKVAYEEIKHVQDLMNGRPRRTLDYDTPNERMALLLR